MLALSPRTSLEGLTADPETAEVNIQLGSHADGDIYKSMHPLKVFVAFHKMRKNSMNEKRR